MKPKISFSEEQKDWIRRPLLSNIDKIIDYRGRTPKKLGLSWSDTGFLALSALNVKNGYIDFNADANYGNQELYDRWMGDNHLHKGQVVFTTEAPMGNVAQIPNDDLYILSQRTIAFEVKHDLIREDFLATLLRSPKIFNELTSLSSGGTAKGVSQKSLSNLKVCVPSSLEEQSAIGSLFRTLDELLASYKDNLANYQSLKATMLFKMFPKAGQTVPEIRLDGFEGEWNKSKLKDVAHRVQGNDGRMDLPTLTISASGGWMNQIDRFSANIAGKEQKNYTLLKKGELSYNHGNSKLAKYGVVFELQDYEEALVPKVYHSFRVNQLADAKFIEIMFSTKIPDRELGKLISSGARMDGLLNISFDDFMNIVIIIPTFAEQQAIGSYFSNLDKLINSHQEKISQLETLKKKLLQDMFI
ncbi:restriction endonuclease subunit S [Streptococcus sp. 20925_1_44]|uniref:restriction endonuclease subunit S n=1 Tax=Streptococcus sp. 20925_1_44 TaxID=3003666 RepID=UPI00352F83A3